MSRQQFRDVSDCLAATLRAEGGRIRAALIARVRDFELAEEALQDAAASAIEHWGRSGLPDRPDAWLIRVAFRKAIDRLRRAGRDRDKAEAVALLARDEAEEPEMIPDERLRLIFTCCHPALEWKSQVALTLRTVCGLTTADIARAFLDQEATMGQRLSRAKARIAATGIGFRVPDAEEWDTRLGAVLSVLYLIFNAGYGEGTHQSRDLGGEAIFLGRLLDHLRPGDPEIQGALALTLLTHARRFARTGPDGATLPPSKQDRSLWDAPMIAEGMQCLNRSLNAPTPPGPYALKAAIAACHILPEQPDWGKILKLYDALLQREPTPVVQLNRAVALAETGEVSLALDALSVLQIPLADYQPFYAVLADLLLRFGQACEAVAAFDAAIDRTTRSEDEVFLRKRRDAAAQKCAETRKTP
ncbi:MAG TPA: sigma factor [Paracoccaceae bacterium]|nr:sigma factor [Paracoccaceae bacterium]